MYQICHRFAESQHLKAATSSKQAKAAHERGQVAISRECAKLNAKVVLAGLEKMKSEKLQQKKKAVTSGDMSGAPLLRYARVLCC